MPVVVEEEGGDEADDTDPPATGKVGEREGDGDGDWDEPDGGVGGPGVGVGTGAFGPDGLSGHTRLS